MIFFFFLSLLVGQQVCDLNKVKRDVGGLQKRQWDEYTHMREKLLESSTYSTELVMRDSAVCVYSDVI